MKKSLIIFLSLFLCLSAFAQIRGGSPAAKFHSDDNTISVRVRDLTIIPTGALADDGGTSATLTLLTPGSADQDYLKLDCSNDPLTDALEITNTAVDTTDDWVGLTGTYTKTDGVTTSSDDFMGAFHFATFDDADQACGQLVGVQGYGIIDSGTASTVRGGFFLATVYDWGENGTTVDIDAIGLEGRVEVGEDATVSQDAIAVKAYVSDLDGTVTGKSIALFLDGGSGIGGDYGIWQNDTSSIFFGGDLAIRQATPHFELNDSNSNDAYQFHVDAGDQTHGIFQLWRGTDTDGNSFAVSPNVPLMYWDDSNNVFFPTSSLTLGALTQGSVLFAGAGGTVTEDNANFFYDDASNVLKVRETLVDVSSTTALLVEDDGTKDNVFVVDTVNGNVEMANDSSKLIFGGGKDATIYYNGVNLIIDPREVGTGYVGIRDEVAVAVIPLASGFDPLILGDETLTVANRVITIGDETYSGLAAYSFDDDDTFPFFSSRRARGSRAAPTAVQADDKLMRFGGAGYHSGGTYPSFSNATMEFYASENFTATNMGTYITFSTTPDGDDDIAEHVRIADDGNVSINLTDADEKLEVNGNIRTSTDGNRYYAGTGKDSYWEFDGNSLNIVANAGTGASTDDLILIGGDATIIQNGTDSTTGFQILDLNGGTPIVNVDTTNERFAVGTATPTGKAHIQGSAVAGALTPSGNAGDLVIENAGNAGITIIGRNTRDCSIHFADPQDTDAGFIDYDHNIDSFNIGTYGDFHWLYRGAPLVYFIGSTGNVGIPTADPDEKLEIGGNIRTSTDGDKYYAGTGKDSHWEFDGDSMNIVANAVTATDDLEITAGDVLINTDLGLFDDDPHLTFADSNDGGNVAFQWHLDTADTTWGIFQLWKGTDADGKSFLVDPNTPLVYWDSNNNAIFPTANVGIGFGFAPTHLFEVYDNTLVTNSITQAQVYIKNTLATASGHASVVIDKGASGAVGAFAFLSAGTALWDAGSYTDGSFFIRDAVDSYKIPFRIEQGAGANALYIESGGDIGVNDSTPDARVEILDTSTQLMLTHTDATDLATFTVDGNGKMIVATVDGGGDAGHIDLAPDGDVKIASADFCIEDTSPHLTFRDSTDGTAFQWHLDEDDTTYGIFQLWRGTDADGYSFLVDPNTPIMYVDDNNDIFFEASRVTKYAWMHAGAIRGQGAGARTGATLTLNDNFWLILSFADNADRYAQANIKIPDDMDLSEDSYICLGWSSPSESLDCDWEVDYLLTGTDDSTEAAGTSTQDYATSSVDAEGLVVSPIATIKGGTITDEICIHISIMRNGGDANDDLDDVAELHGMAFKYTANKLGESQ